MRNELVFMTSEALPVLDFIKGNLSSSIVKLYDDEMSAMIKTTDALGFTHLMIKNHIYQGDREYLSINAKDFDVVLCIYSAEKEIFAYSDFYKEEIAGIFNYFAGIGYETLTYSDIVSEMREKYQDKYLLLLAEKLNNLTDLEKEEIKIESERTAHSNIRSAKRDFINDVPMKQLGYAKENGPGLFIENYKGANFRFSFEESSILMAELYLSEILDIEEITEKYFEEDFSCRGYAFIKSENEVYSEIYNNPANSLLKLRDFNRAIAKGGQTLTLKLFNEENLVKVENRLHIGEDCFLNSIVGYDSYYVKDIEYVKFGRKIIWENK